MAMRWDVRGIDEAREELARVAGDLAGGPMGEGMRQATLVVTRDARINAPVDTGRLRASITPEVRMQSMTVLGVVGSNVEYAPYVELGTRAHWPPPGTLAVWARRHGMPEFLVQRAIARRGTKAVKYLERAVTQNVSEIVRILSDAVARIIRG